MHDVEADGYELEESRLCSGGHYSSLDSDRLSRYFGKPLELCKNYRKGKEKPPYRNAQHTHKCFEIMNTLRKQQHMCDVSLVTDDGTEIPVHKVVLSSCSPYFYAMFTGWQESQLDKVNIQGIDKSALELLVNYAYTAEILVTEDNVQLLLPASNLLQLLDVSQACCDFLHSQLHPSNCLGIRSFADLHGCTDLLRFVQSYVEQHFVDVIENDEFFALTSDQVRQLISSDKLLVPNEESVFEAVMAWIHFDSPNRQPFVADMLEQVRLPLLNQEYLVQRVDEEPLLKTSSECKDLLIEAMKYHLMKPEQKIVYHTPRTKPRTPSGLPKVLLVVGGQAPKAIRSVEAYDFKEERWYQVAEMPTRRCREGLAVVNGLVYAVGGFNGSLRVRTVDVYDVGKDQWTSVASMEARRSTLGVGVIDYKIYAVGGFDGTTGLNSAEVYNTLTNEWKTISPMSVRRSSVGVGVLCGLLYAVGGYDGVSRQCLSSVECYHPETDNWVSLGDMSSRRSGAGVGVLDGILYAVGGHDGPLVRKSVECYNPATCTWSPVADMFFCRRNAGVVSLNGLLYVVGGDDGSSNLPSVEVYNPKVDSWMMLLSSMDVGRSYAGVAVLDKMICFPGC